MSDRRFVRRRSAGLPIILLLVATLCAAYSVPTAQTPAKKALTIDDYTKWKSINAPAWRSASARLASRMSRRMAE